jgi:ribosomal protein L37AE/L43A
MDVKFCPFCGSDGIGIRKSTKLWWCPKCRKTWLLNYWRQLRKKATRKGATHDGRAERLDEG